MGKYTVVHPCNGVLFSAKNMPIKHKKKHGRTLNAYYCVKDPNLNRLHTIYFQPHDFWKTQNCGDSKKV